MLLLDIDPRLAKWPFMEDAAKTNLIVIAYLAFVKIIGPAYMKNKHPYNLRFLMIIYNFGIVIYSGWMFYKFVKHGWFGRYTWICEPITQSTDEESMEMVRACWHFSISKIIELMDTVFFVLRKKDSQISFLHVIHHSLAIISTRYGVSHAPSGYNTLVPFLNTFVHIWMYLYYALAALGPFMQKFLWWKKYLTMLQIIQLIGIIVGMTTYAYLPDCHANPVLVINSLGPSVLFLVLFLSFYISAYSKKKPLIRAAGTTVSETVTKPPHVKNTAELKRRYMSNNN